MRGGKSCTNKTGWQKGRRVDKRRIKRRKMITSVHIQSLSAPDSDWEHDSDHEAEKPGQWYRWDWASEQIPAVSHSVRAAVSCMNLMNEATGSFHLKLFVCKSQSTSSCECIEICMLQPVAASPFVPPGRLLTVNYS